MAPTGDNLLPVASNHQAQYKSDMAVYRYVNGIHSGQFWVLYHPFTGAPFQEQVDHPNSATAIPLTYRQNGNTRLAVWSPETGEIMKWSQMPAMQPNKPLETTAAAPGELLRFADRDGDGNDELVVYSPTTGSLYNSNPLEVVNIGSLDSFALSR